MTRRIVLFLSFWSGFAALHLELIWARRLSLLTGNGVRAAGTVTALTLAGLAIGSRAAGRWADRLERPLLAYALAEMGVAVWAIVTLHALPPLGRWALTPIPLQGGIVDFGWGAFFAASTLVIPAAFLMGTTTPVLVRLLPDLPGAGLGKLYGWNTLGGAAGALFGVFVLLPAAGLAAATYWAAGTEFLVATSALVLHINRRRLPEPPLPDGHSPVPRRSERSEEPSNSHVRISLILAGALGALCQVAWVRILALLFGNSLPALGITLAASLAGMALGSVYCARVLAAGTPPAKIVRRGWLVGTGWSLMSLLAWGKLPPLIAFVQGGFSLSFPGTLALQTLLCLLLVVPLAAVLGSLLPALTGQLDGRVGTDGLSAGRGLSIDSWGSVAGGLAALHLGLPLWGVENILRGIVVLQAVLLALARPGTAPRAGRIRVRIGTRVAALGLGMVALVAPNWDPALMTSGPLLYGGLYARAAHGRWEGIEEAMRRRGRILFMEEGTDSTVTVRASGGIRSLQINGKTDASSGGDLASQVLMGEIPALLHPAPRRALIIGLASGTTAGAVAAHGVERLDCVEISPEVARAARFFSSVNGAVLDDSRFHLYLGDGRSFLQRVRSRYDLIVSQPTNPWIVGVSTLFTREFFLLARDRLAPAGILAVWLQGYAMDPRDFQAVVGTFLDAFPDAQLWEESPGGGDYYLVGTNGGRPPAIADLATRLAASPRIASDLARAGIRTPADLLSRFLGGSESLKAMSGDAPRVTDDNLRLEFTAPRGLWALDEGRLLARLESYRRSPWDTFPSPPPESSAIREMLEDRERSRRSRIRLALQLRRPDLEALSLPDLAAASSLVRIGRGELAVPLLRRAQTEAPSAPAVPLLLGWLLLEQGDLGEAEKSFQEALRRDAGSGEAANGIGLVRWKQSDLAGAAAYFRRSLELDPAQADPISNLGSVLLAQGRTADALPLLGEAIRLDPRHVPARINRGVALARLGRFGEAEEEYRKALSLEPLNEDVLYNLKRLQERRSSSGEAK